MQAVALLSRYWPFANGSGRIIDKFGQTIDAGSGRKLAKTSDGFSLTVMADDLIGRHILLSGKFDRSIVQVLLDHARDGDVLLDIGANIGYVTSCFLANVAASTAICIEPQPGVVDLLKSNVGQFGHRATVHQCALSDRDGELRFHVDESNRGASRITKDGEIVVPAASAAKLLASVPKVDMIKIDVEGHELAIFTSIEQELRRLRPRVILFEHHGTAAGPTGAIGALLARAGYRVLGIRKALLRTTLRPVEAEARRRFSDYLAVAQWV